MIEVHDQEFYPKSYLIFYLAPLGMKRLDLSQSSTLYCLMFNAICSFRTDQALFKEF